MQIWQNSPDPPGQAYCGIVTSHTSLQSMFVQESKGLKELQEVSYQHKFYFSDSSRQCCPFHMYAFTSIQFTLTCNLRVLYCILSLTMVTDVYWMTDLIKECNMQLTPSNTHFVHLPPSSLQKGQIEVVTHVQ